MPKKTSKTVKHQHELGSKYLTMLLRDREYRQHWQRRCPPELAVKHVDQASVTQVLASFLIMRGEEPDDFKPRALKDLVSRALSGTSLTPRTLSLFARAFGFSRDDMRFLNGMFTGTLPDKIPDSVTAKFFQPPAPTVQLPYKVIRHEERLSVGPEGRPWRRRAVRHIQATSELSSLALRLVDIVRPEFGQIEGGEVTELTQIFEDSHLATIGLARTLQRGDTHTIDYTVREAGQGPQRFRHLTIGHEDLSLAVQFDPTYAPRTAGFEVWHDFAPYAERGSRENVLSDLGPDKILTKSLGISDTTVGFAWTD